MKFDPKKLNALSVELYGRRIGVINRLAGDRHLFAFEQDYLDDPGRRPYGGARFHHHERGERGERAERGLRNLRNLRRSSQGRVLAGLCSGLSQTTGIDVTILRIGLVLIGLASGVPVLVYALAWLVVPMDQETTNIFSRAITDRRGIRLVVAVIPVVIVTQVVVSALHIGFVGSAMLTSLPAILGKYRRLYSRVQLHLNEFHTSQLIDALREGSVDVALARDAGTEP